MKTFVATFSAILCAAAVIWGIVSYRENNTAHAASDLKFLQSSAKYAEATNSLATDGDAEFSEARKSDVMSAQVFLMIMKRHSADRTATNSAASDYVFYQRETVKYWKTKQPKWAAELTPVLDEIEKEEAH